eukprot:TRINITY_DN295_c0_g1_i1.p3 TRINITY_DN295_c0_g1~~TRINITY_DN295_c0_g1_i1.p3  ORF type:complete len:105 (-),score=25.70 TRINITY_DN295_c0_g1_i1:709-1023(-)
MASDSKKEEFRKYLERSGVIDSLTKVLVGLYEEPEKPSNALDFVKQYLGAPIGVDIDQLKTENENLKKENEELKKKLAELQKVRYRHDCSSIIPIGIVQSDCDI